MMCTIRISSRDAGRVMNDIDASLESTQLTGTQVRLQLRNELNVISMSLAFVRLL